jgi:hypothetical protein
MPIILKGAGPPRLRRPGAPPGMIVHRLLEGTNELVRVTIARPFLRQ